MPAAALAAALAFAGGGVARAQSDAPKKYKAQPLILEKEQLGTAAMTNTGRTRMRNGDCVGALDAFDSVLRTAVDPTVSRDRGICHETLGHAYPAIDDYRTYLTAQPEAPDAEGIRGRLEHLEQETTGRSSASSDVPDDVEGGSAGGGSKQSALLPPRDKMDYIDRDDDAAQHSPLRRSRGWAFAPFLSEHKWFSSGTAFGDSSTWSECLGLQVRYSLGKTVALFFEVGYEHYNTTVVDPATISGVTSQIGLEFRFPLDPSYDNQLFLAPGIGYQHIVSGPSDPQLASTTLGGIVPRVRLGYRHMLAATVALDLAIDVGVAKYFDYTDSSVDQPTQELVAFWVGADWGL